MFAGLLAVRLSPATAYSRLLIRSTKHLQLRMGGSSNNAIVSVGIKFPIKTYVENACTGENPQDEIYNFICDGDVIVDDDKNGDCRECLYKTIDELREVPMPEYKTELVGKLQNSSSKLYERHLLVPVHRVLGASIWGAGYATGGVSMSLDRAKEIINQDIGEELKGKFPGHELVLMIGQYGGEQYY